MPDAADPRIEAVARVLWTQNAKGFVTFGQLTNAQREELFARAIRLVEAADRAAARTLTPTED